MDEIKNVKVTGQGIFGGYEYLTSLELIRKILEKINEVITETNTYTEIVKELRDWLNRLDISDEVNKKLDEMETDGTLADLINVTIFNDLNNKIANTEKYISSKINVVSLGVDNTGSKNVSDLLNSIIQANDYKTLYFPDGIYNIDKEILINNYVCLELSSNATFKAVAQFDNMIHINRTAEKIKQFISGGVLDGNGKVQRCIYSTYCANFQIYNMVIKNALMKNIYLFAGYEFYLENLHIDNSLSYDINPNIVGIELSATDSVIRNIIVKNNTIGIINNQVSNEFYSIHVWGNILTRLPYTIAFVANAETRITQFYSDTCAVGIKTNGYIKVYITKGMFIFSDDYLQNLPNTTPLFIDNLNSTVYLYNVRLSSYIKNSVISNYMNRVHLYNCSVSDPFKTDSKYFNIMQYGQMFYKLVLSEFTVPANGYKRISIPATDILYNDYFIYNVIGESDVNLQHKAYTYDKEFCIIFFNNSDTPITKTSTTINLIKYINNGISITTLNHTVI